MNKTWMLDRPAEVVDELAQVKDTFYESTRYAHLVPDVMDEEVRLFSGKRCSPLPNGVQFPHFQPGLRIAGDRFSTC